jgi:multiple sugar transport system substrate-binding protein
MNWTFVYKGAGYTEEQVQDLGWARYPQTVAGEESRPPVGGINIGVNAASDDLDFALEAAACVTDKQSQITLATTDGLMPATSSLYDAPELAESYPADLLTLFRESLEAGGPRPISAVWNDMSLAIQTSWHPPTSVTSSTPASSKDFILAVLHGEALV